MSLDLCVASGKVYYYSKSVLAYSIQLFDSRLIHVLQFCLIHPRSYSQIVIFSTPRTDFEPICLLFLIFHIDIALKVLPHIS